MSEPVLTSSWCTAWGSYNTPRLWAMVKDEDDPEAWRQVAAWGEISGAMKDQRALLVEARESLAAAWPPEQNKSSAAFVKEVDKLIARMDEARTEADDTATGLANILEALRQAKQKIEPLWEQYKQKSDDLVPAWWDNAEDELDRQAQAHMITAEQIVQENVARLRVPELYALEPADPHFTPKPLATGGGSDTGRAGGIGVGGSIGAGVGGGGAGVPVPHDPVPPLPGHEPTVPDGPASPAAGGGVGVGSGPGLAGVINPPAAGPPSATPLPSGGGLPPGGGGGPGIVPPAGPIVGPGAGTVGPLGSGGGSRGRGSAGQGGIGTDRAEPGTRGGLGTSGVGAGGVGGIGRGARPGGRPAAAGRQALPSGAVIGETVAGAGRGVAGAPGGGGAGGVGGGAGRRVAGAPGDGGVGVGGVGGAAGRGGAAAWGQGAGGQGIGARGVAGRGAEPVRPPRPSWLPDEPVGAARPAGFPGTAGGARGRRSSGESEQQTFDPDNPWQVAEGVEPVIAPGQDTARHDPGPNVIGWRG